MKTERIIWAIVILMILGWIVNREIQHRSKEKGLQTMIEVLNDTVSHHKNERGEWEAERKSFNLTNKELRRYGQELGVQNSRLKKRVGSLNNLVAHLQGEILIAGDGEVKLIPADTIYSSDSSKYFIGHRFDWTNQYLSLSGTLNDTYNLQFKYTYEVDFEVTTYWKREKRFKRKDLVVNFTMSDPNAKAVGLNSVVIKPDKPKFFETTWFKVGVGFIGGVLITNL